MWHRILPMVRAGLAFHGLASGSERSPCYSNQPRTTQHLEFSLELGSLELLWDLELGIWSFSLSYCDRPTFSLLQVRCCSCMIVLTLTWIGIACWMVCFWWMHRISSRQETMLQELHEMTTRIEQLSRAEHDLISEVHPQVSEIKEHVENVAQKV